MTFHPPRLVGHGRPAGILTPVPHKVVAFRGRPPAGRDRPTPMGANRSWAGWPVYGTSRFGVSRPTQTPLLMSVA